MPTQQTKKPTTRTPRKRQKRRLTLPRIANTFSPTSYNIIMAIILLITFGCVMIYSASAYESATSKSMNNDYGFLFKKQFGFALFGIVVMILTALICKTRWLKNLAWLGYFVSLVLLIMLKVGNFGVTVNGATRWLKIGPLPQFQVAEVVKLALILFIAYMMDEYGRTRDQGKLALKIWGYSILLALTCLILSKNLSSAIILGGICFGITLIFSPFFKEHIALLAIVIVGAFFYVLYVKFNMPDPEAIKDNFRLGRVAGWLDPDAYSSSVGFQINQGLYAIGSGGLFGKGLGNGTQKFQIPEVQNDMIFCHICEELGIFGAVLLICLFVFLLYQIFIVAINAEDKFGSVFATAVFIHLALQIVINIAVACNAIPNTGCSLPFISYGGSSIVFLLVEMGIVLLIEREHVIKEHERMLKEQRNL